MKQLRYIFESLLSDVLLIPKGNVENAVEGIWA